MARSSRRQDVIDVFNSDVVANRGYLYTTKAGLSSAIANRRLTDAALGALNFVDKRVIDIGCGDGSYTVEIFDRGRPSIMVGLDLSREAIKVAEKRRGSRPIRFEVHTDESLPFSPDAFDIAHLRGVLHHTARPIEALRESLRVARMVILLEPNGYNPILKIIERFSPYHITHRERSFLPSTIDAWVAATGGVVISRRYAGTVPFFCPHWIAILLKWLEPFIEKMPLANRLLCGVYICVIAHCTSST